MTAAHPTSIAEIERAVQHRAKTDELDMATETGRSALRALVDDELRRRSSARKRGDHHTDEASHTIAERVWRNLALHGPLTDLLTDPDVWEIEINSPRDIFVKRHAGIDGYHHECFHDDDHVVRTLTKLLDESSSSHRRLDPTEGLQDAQLDDGSRLHIVHADVARGGHTMVNIRRFTGVPFRDLDQLVEHGTLDRRTAGFLAQAVRVGTTVVFAGAPGSGKTTLLSCCLGQLDPTRRVVIAEEVFEVDAALPNVASMQTRAGRPDRPAIDLRRLVAGFLRMAPDVAVVGEVRDREAMPLLLTLSSGVTGFTTIHAAHARGALSRLRFLAELSDGTTSMPHSALTLLVSEAIDLVVHSERGPDGPRVREILAVEDPVGGGQQGVFTVTDLMQRVEDRNALEWTGQVPARLCRRFAAAGVDMVALLRDGEAGR